MFDSLFICLAKHTCNRITLININNDQLVQQKALALTKIYLQIPRNAEKAQNCMSKTIFFFNQSIFSLISESASVSESNPL